VSLAREAVAPASPSLTSLARTLSVAAHPLPVTVLLVLAQGASPALALTMAALLLLPLALFLRHQVRRGAWEHVDASRPEERPALFRLALGLLGGALAATLLLLPAPGALARGLAGALVLIGVAYAALRWTKLSLHLAFAGYAAGVLLPLRPATGLALLGLLPLLAWSRLHLRRHRLSETVAGAVLGIAVGLGVT
jgi:hypothetical protein